MKNKRISRLLALVSLVMVGCSAFSFSTLNIKQGDAVNYTETYTASDLATANGWTDGCEINSEIKKTNDRPNLTISPLNDYGGWGCMVFYIEGRGIGLKFANSTSGGLDFSVHGKLNSICFTYSTNFSDSKLKYKLSGSTEDKWLDSGVALSNINEDSLSFINDPVRQPELESTTWVWISSISLTFYSSPYLTLTPTTTSMFVGDSKTFTIATHDFDAGYAPTTFAWSVSGVQATLTTSLDTLTCEITPTASGRATVTATGISPQYVSWTKQMSFDVVAPGTSIAEVKTNYSAGGAVRATGIIYAKYSNGFYIADSDGVGIFVSPSDTFDESKIIIGDKITVDGKYSTKTTTVVDLSYMHFGYYIANATLTATISSNNEVAAITLDDDTIKALNVGSTTTLCTYLGDKFKGSGTLTNKNMVSQVTTSTYYDQYLTSTEGSQFGMIVNPNSYDQTMVNNYIVERNSYTVNTSIVTISGPLAFTFNGNISGDPNWNLIGVLPTEESSYYSEASYYSKDFLNTTDVCDSSGVVNNITASMWYDLSYDYSLLSDSAKADLLAASSSTTGSLTSRFAARYDYIVAKYSYSNFISRTEINLNKNLSTISSINFTYLWLLVFPASLCTYIIYRKKKIAKSK